MPVHFHRFDRYHVNYLTPGHSQRRDQILIFCSRLSDEQQLESVGSIRFWRGDIPMNAYYGPTNVILNYSVDDFTRILDLLRVEKPCYLAIDPETRFGYIATRYEAEDLE